MEGNLQEVVSLLEQGVNVDTTEGSYMYVSYCEHVAIFGMHTILDCSMAQPLPLYETCMVLTYCLKQCMMFLVLLKVSVTVYL